MEERINYNKRRKGMLAIVICMTVLLGTFYRPMVAKATLNNTVSVTGVDTPIIAGCGDSISFTGGVYGYISLDGNRVFPDYGEVDIEIEKAGTCSGPYSTDKAYTIEYSGGLCVKETIEFYSYDQVVELMQQQNGEFPAGANIDENNSFAIVSLKKVNGCKVQYMDDDGTVVHTDYVVTDANSPVSGTATTVWGGLTKENAELIGWGFSPNSGSLAFQIGDSLMDGSGSMSLYPIWEMVEEEESEPEPKPIKPVKSSGIVNVSMNGYIYGGLASTPQISSTTNDVSKATVTYKAVGASDATYSSQKPTAVGNYMVRVVLPGNDNYGQAVGTANFSIGYLPAPSPAYKLGGVKGNSGWYKSEVLIIPPEGYELSVGNRAHFSTAAYEVSESTQTLNIYLKKISTGELTDVITLSDIRIDSKAPDFLDLHPEEEYYVDEMQFSFVEDYYQSVTINGEETEILSDEGNIFTVAFSAAIKRMTYTIILTDEAGNQTEIMVTVGPAWLKDGIVGEGEYYLEAQEEYHFPKEGEWQKAGDNTIYAGGTDFYSTAEGIADFSMK